MDSPFSHHIQQLWVLDLLNSELEIKIHCLLDLSDVQRGPLLLSDGSQGQEGELHHEVNEFIGQVRELLQL